MREVQIRDDMVRLGQLLKLADIADTGAAAKDMLAQEQVSVNGEVETRRGRQLGRGDVVTARGEEIQIV
jgi:ribosome-associated protein